MHSKNPVHRSSKHPVHLSALVVQQLFIGKRHSTYKTQKAISATPLSVSRQIFLDLVYLKMRREILRRGTAQRCSRSSFRLWQFKDKRQQFKGKRQKFRGKSQQIRDKRYNSSRKLSANYNEFILLLFTIYVTSVKA